MTLGRDPAAADELLTAVREQTRTAIATIRRLVHGLRPPALDDLGLARALRAHVATIAQPAVSLELHGDLDTLPPATEVATYWIVVEALTNVTRHSGARHCLVRVGDEDVRAGEVRIEVRDDGVGIGAEYRHGVGLASMRERAEEIGGAFAVSADPAGGTVVQVRLPAPTPRADAVAVQAS